MRVRQMEAKDIKQVAALCQQFGYPSTTEQVQERFDRLGQSRENQIFVAEDTPVVVGWIHVQGIHSISSPTYAEIRGIVVDQNHRQRGIGRMLMQSAEQWSLDHGYRIVRLRSGTGRPESHHFYPQLGYERTKTQHHYQKVLVDS